MSDREHSRTPSGSADPGDETREPMPASGAIGEGMSAPLRETRQDKPAPPEIQEEIPSSRMASLIEPVARGARSFVGFFGWMSGLSLAAAGLLTLVTFLPFGAFAVWKVAALVVTLLGLSIPGLVLLIFRFGLLEVVELPERLATAATGMIVSSRQSYTAMSEPANGKLARLVILVRTLVDIRSLLLQSRDMALRSTMLVRVANPIVLVVVLASLVVSVILIAAATLVGAIAVL